MNVEELIKMLEDEDYPDDAPIVIRSDTGLVYSSTFGEFKIEWSRYRIY